MMPQQATSYQKRTHSPVKN